MLTCDVFLRQPDYDVQSDNAGDDDTMHSGQLH